MLSSKEFHALPQEQKIMLLQNMLQDAYTASPVLWKIYAYITSELPKDDAVLDSMYAWIADAQRGKNQQDVQNNIDTVKKLQQQWTEEFDEKHLDDLLAKM